MGIEPDRVSTQINAFARLSASRGSKNATFQLGYPVALEIDYHSDHLAGASEPKSFKSAIYPMTT